MLPAPPIDSRISDDVVRQLIRLMRIYSGNEASETAPEVGFFPDKGASRALVEIFGRFTELIIGRLNQVPNKNLLAFLDLIGASLLPPQPARVPLTFSLANGSIVDGVVRARTQVAAVSAAGETAPVVFETEQELVVTAAQLVSLFVRVPAQDRYSDRSTFINSIPTSDVVLFNGNHKFEHSLYLAHDAILGDPNLTTLTLVFEAKSAVPQSSWNVSWDRWSPPNGWLNLHNSNITDGTAGLTKSGEITFQNLPLFQRTDVNGMNKFWLRCRLLTFIPPGTYGDAGKLAEFNSVQIKAATSKATGLKIDHIITNETKVDAVKGFFPFGERPKTGDTFYLAHPGAFSKNGATITLHLQITNSPKAVNVNLVFEVWDGNAWSSLTKPAGTTINLTESCDITLTIPKQPVSTTINGIESFWLRCRIAGGNYGAEARFTLKDPNDASKGYVFTPATYAPPLIDSVTVDYSIPQTTITPEVVLTANDYIYQRIGSTTSFKPFQAVQDRNPTIYLGFTLPTGLEKFPNRKISLYVALAEFTQGETQLSSPVIKKPELSWEYWSGKAWAGIQGDSS